MTDFCLSKVRPLTSEEKEYSVENLNETDENRENGLDEIKRWIMENKDLCAHTEDFFILRFLRVCKFNIEKTKYKMRNYYQQRCDMPEWYMKRDPFLPEVQELLDLGVFLPLRKLDDHGRMIIFIRSTQHDPHKHKLSDVIKACMMILDLMTRDHVPGSLYGVVAFIDIEHAKFAHALQLRPHIVKQLVHAWQGCYPLRIQSIRFINVPIYVNAVLSIFKQFMNKKLKQRLSVYTCNMKKDCCKDLPANILPSEYGGTDGTIKELKEYWKKAVENNRDWFANEEKYKVISNTN